MQLGGRSFHDLREVEKDCEIRIIGESGGRSPAGCKSPSGDKFEGVGLLRRAFSSKRCKKKKPTVSGGTDTLLIAGDFLAPPSPLRGASRSQSSELLSPFYLSPDDAGSQSDLTSRRGVFSRKTYGSADMLNNALELEGMTNNAGAFRAELGSTRICDNNNGNCNNNNNNGNNSKSGCSNNCCNNNTSTCGKVEEDAYKNSPIHVENPESQTRWYFKYFLGRMHQNFVGVDGDKESFVLSVIQNDPSNATHLCRAILWRKKGSQKISIPCSQAREKLTAKQILSHFDVTKFEMGPKEVLVPEIQKDILTLEEQEGSMNYKFGVIYMREGQTTDDAMYGNENGSPQFENFVRLLGDEVTMKGWEHFRGGLDNKSDTTGIKSIYTVFDGHEIMFHVSTMLPYTPDNRQQVERKRHVGNDIVNIIFVDGCNSSPSWRPAMMKTHFTHIFAIVTFNEERGTYRLNVYSQNAVPLFGPPLPVPTEFAPKEFREFLLVKLINGEKSAFHIPVFAQKREKTVEMLIKSILEQYAGESGRFTLVTRKSNADMIVTDQAVIAKNKEDARQMEFVKLGQTLKLKTILNGDAPTSLITSSVMKREPWQPHPYMNDLPDGILCGDSWGDRLIICNSKGTYLLEDENTKMLIDNSLLFSQLDIVEIYNLLIGLPEKGNKNLYVIQLARLDDCDVSTGPFSGMATSNDTPLSATHPLVTNSSSIKDQQSLATNAYVHNLVQSRSYSMPPQSLAMTPAPANPPLTPPVTAAYQTQSQFKQFLPRDKASLKCCKLEKTKGCSTYCLSKPFSNPLRLAVALGKRLLLFIWRSMISKASSLSQWNQFQESNVEAMFHFVREYSTSEVIELIRLIDGPKGSVRFVIGCKNQFELRDELSGDVLQIYRIDSAIKANLISAMDICADYEAELLLTYNCTSRVQKMNDSSVSELAFKWNGEPQAIVCAFPYVLAFTSDTIEIRLLINGNLVHTMALPSLHYITSKCDVYFATSAMLPSLSVVSAPSFATIMSKQQAQATAAQLQQQQLQMQLLQQQHASCGSAANLLSATPSGASLSLATTPMSSTASSSGVWSDVRSPCLSVRERDRELPAFRTASKASSDAATKEHQDYAAQKLTVYRIPLACLTLGNCSLEKMRTAVHVGSLPLPLSNTLSLTSQLSSASGTGSIDAK